MGPRDDRIPELVDRLKILSADIVKICGDEKTAAVFVERTVRQLRCNVGTCLSCGRMTCGALMCLACQRIAIFGDDVNNAPPKKSKQISYVTQFEVKMLKRAKKHMHNCLRASKAKKIQALVRGFQVRNTVRPKPSIYDWRNWREMEKIQHKLSTEARAAQIEYDRERSEGGNAREISRRGTNLALYRSMILENYTKQVEWRNHFGFRDWDHIQVVWSQLIVSLEEA